MNDYGTALETPVKIFLLTRDGYVTGWTEDRSFAYSCCAANEVVVEMVQR